MQDNFVAGETSVGVVPGDELLSPVSFEGMVPIEMPIDVGPGGFPPTPLYPDGIPIIIDGVPVGILLEPPIDVFVPQNPAIVTPISTDPIG